jgi:hypothetical protein
MTYFRLLYRQPPEVPEENHHRAWLWRFNDSSQSSVFITIFNNKITNVLTRCSHQMTVQNVGQINTVLTVLNQITPEYMSVALLITLTCWLIVFNTRWELNRIKTGFIRMKETVIRCISKSNKQTRHKVGLFWERATGHRPSNRSAQH